MCSRHTLSIVLGVLLLAKGLWATSPEDWKTVKDLKWDSPLRVELWSGQEYAGRFDMADDQVFRLKVYSHDAAGRTGSVLTFSREQVRIVLKISNHDPDLENYRRAGMIAGGIAGAAVLGTTVNHAAWPGGVAFGGLLGVAAGALVGDMAGLVAHGTGHRQKVIYESRTQPPVAKPPAPHEH